MLRAAANDVLDALHAAVALFKDVPTSHDQRAVGNGASHVTDTVGRIAELSPLLQQELGRNRPDYEHMRWLLVMSCRLVSLASTVFDSDDLPHSPRIEAADAGMQAIVQQCRQSLDIIFEVTTPLDPSGSTTEHKVETVARLEAVVSAVRKAFGADSDDRPQGSSGTYLRRDERLPAAFFAGVVGEALSIVDEGDSENRLGTASLVTVDQQSDAVHYRYVVELVADRRVLRAHTRDVPLVSPITLLAGPVSSNAPDSPGVHGAAYAMRDAHEVEVPVVDDG